MAKIADIDQSELDAWLSTRPESIQKLAKQIPPGRLYRMENQRVFPYSYNEDGTLTVIVSGEYNSIVFERSVFGVKPESLVECDLPEEGEELGTMLTDQKDIDEHIKSWREENELTADK